MDKKLNKIFRVTKKVVCEKTNIFNFTEKSYGDRKHLNYKIKTIFRIF